MQNSVIKVFGHLSPDTDATASAIIMAWYLTHIKGTPATPYVLGEPNTEAQFVLQHWGFESPEILTDVDDDQDVVIVDTNNRQELPPNINNANILQIVDHHKLVAGLETKAPAEITIKPLASTASVIGPMMMKQWDQVPRGIKGLILSCIISDTLEFRSPTTTECDKRMAANLAEELAVDISELATLMFTAKSNIDHFTDAELIRLDSKKYEVGGTNFRVSVLETTNPQAVLDRQAAIVEAMNVVAQEDAVDQVLFFVVDILQEQATLLVPNDLVKTVAQASFGVNVEGDTVVLPGIVSRKKQIIPVLKV